MITPNDLISKLNQHFDDRVREIQGFMHQCMIKETAQRLRSSPNSFFVTHIQSINDKRTELLKLASSDPQLFAANLGKYLQQYFELETRATRSEITEVADLSPTSKMMLFSSQRITELKELQQLARELTVSSKENRPSN